MRGRHCMRVLPTHQGHRRGLHTTVQVRGLTRVSTSMYARAHQTFQKVGNGECPEGRGNFTLIINGGCTDTEATSIQLK
jgi:hypothetical protein